MREELDPSPLQVCHIIARWAILRRERGRLGTPRMCMLGVRERSCSCNLILSCTRYFTGITKALFYLFIYFFPFFTLGRTFLVCDSPCVLLSSLSLSCFFSYLCKVQLQVRSRSVAAFSLAGIRALRASIWGGERAWGGMY